MRGDGRAPCRFPDFCFPRVPERSRPFPSVKTKAFRRGHSSSRFIRVIKYSLCDPRFRARWRGLRYFSLNCTLSPEKQSGSCGGFASVCGTVKTVPYRIFTAPSTIFQVLFSNQYIALSCGATGVRPADSRFLLSTGNGTVRILTASSTIFQFLFSNQYIALSCGATGVRPADSRFLLSTGNGTVRILTASSTNFQFLFSNHYFRRR